MKTRALVFGLSALASSFAWGQGETYRVPGFPPFAPAPKMLEVLEDRGDTVLVRHAQGETEVPKNPQRIVATDAAALEMLLSLGLKPVGALTFGEPVKVIRDMAEGVTLLTVADGVNLEAVLTLQPDLIVGWYNMENYAQLSQIAPTLEFMGNSATYWQQATLDFAGVFGKRALAENLVSDYNMKLEQARARLDDVMGSSTVSVIRALPSEGLSLNAPGYEGSTFGQAKGYIPYQPTRWLYHDLQRLPGPEVREIPLSAGRLPFTGEFFPQLQADYLLVLVPSPEDRQVFETSAEANPLWRLVPAVANGRTVVLNIGNYDGYYTNISIIDAFTEAVTAKSAP